MKKLKLARETILALDAVKGVTNPNMDSCAPTYCLSDLTCLPCTIRWAD